MYLFNKTKLNKYIPFSSDIPNQLLTNVRQYDSHGNNQTEYQINREIINQENQT